MAANEISLTIKLDEDDWKAIERAVMSIEKRLERVEAILDARGLDWDHPRVASDHFVGAGKMVANEPPKKWRILEPGEVVCSGDRVTAKANLPSDPPHGLGWRPVDASVGTSVCEGDACIFARPVADEPAKEPEPEHLAGPMPDPGEGYRLLSKDPPEELQEGDELQCVDGIWGASANARTHKRQGPSIWYRRKIEQPKPAWEPKVGDWVKVTRPDDWIEWEHPRWEGSMHQFGDRVGQIECEWDGHFQICGFAASNDFRYQFHRDWLSPAEPPAIDKPPEPEYREPVLPADCGKQCEFSDDGDDWTEAKLQGYAGCFWISVSSEVVGAKVWEHARIKVDA